MLVGLDLWGEKQRPPKSSVCVCLFPQGNHSQSKGPPQHPSLLSASQWSQHVQALHLMGPSLTHTPKTYLHMGVQAVQSLQNGCGESLWVLGGSGC